MGESKNLALSGVTWPPVRSVRRTPPAMIGTRLRKIREAGTSHLVFGLGRERGTVAVVMGSLLCAVLGGA
ncbi:hypothetical protein GCM10011577_40160 [Pseudarthrobacter polychromogenes]|uniref:Uncharacterized protein n=1 Tax=Pseudarthrobacter polychromogenes TaxID=1676 RepID=A0ABQ1Y449_9MICC|nr:hypothetical protein GCM10011577_40160 [Pseudarthrobacter polychromogenes]